MEHQEELRRDLVPAILAHTEMASFLTYRDAGGYVRYAVWFEDRHQNYVMGLRLASIDLGGVEIRPIATPSVLECGLAWEMEMAGYGGAPLPHSTGICSATTALGTQITDTAYRLLVCQRVGRSPVVSEWERRGGHPVSLGRKTVGVAARKVRNFLAASDSGAAAKTVRANKPPPIGVKPSPHTHARIILGAATEDQLAILQDTFPAGSLRRRRAVRLGDVATLAMVPPKVPLINAAHFPVFSNAELDTLNIIPMKAGEVLSRPGLAPTTTTSPPMRLPYINDWVDNSAAPPPGTPFLADDAGRSREAPPPGGALGNVGLPDGSTIIGYVNDRPDPSVPLDTITIPEEHRLHAMVLGSEYGKSAILKTLILQHLIRGEGVAILDLHHDLAAWTTRRIPRWRANQLVYISPAQLLRTNKTVPINPLGAYSGMPGTAATAFTKTLMNTLNMSGTKTEALLINAATAVIASGQGGLGLLRRIIVDKSERNIVLADVHLGGDLYWKNIFPKLSKEEVHAVDNKLMPIVSNLAVGPFFEGDTIFDMARLLDGNGILIFDGAGCDNDSERKIFATFLLDMITTSAANLAQSHPQGVKIKPFYLYVDGMQMLDSSKLKEMLQHARKWGIRITLATQQLDSIDAGNASDMIGDCDLCMVSRCTPATAEIVASKMDSGPDELTRIPQHCMNYHMSTPPGDIHGRMLRMRGMDCATASWKTLAEVVDRSLANYGVDVNTVRYANEPGYAYDVSPLEMAMLSALYHRSKGLRLDDICETVARFATKDERVPRLLDRLVRSGRVAAVSGVPATVYTLRPAIINRYFDTAALRGRAGGDLHIRTIVALQDYYSRLGYFTRMDVGDTTAPQPDLEVCEPAIGPDGAPDPDRWGRRVAIEVETGPSRHPNKPGNPGQVYKNWKKSPGMTVWFLVYKDNDLRVVKSQLDKMGVGPDEYKVDVISAEGVQNGTAIPVPPGFKPTDPLPHCSTISDLD